MADESSKSTEKVEKAAKDAPEWKGSLSADEELVAPDGHVTLSQEDIDAREES